MCAKGRGHRDNVDLEEACMEIAASSGTELKSVLENHKKWANGETGGQRANLSYANLSRADLTGADLSYANLTGAYLNGANLSRAYLGRAYLTGANLQETVLDNINWLAYLGIVAVDGKARAYKMTTADGWSPTQSTGRINYETDSEFEATLDKDSGTQCGAGINLATLQWCMANKNDGHRLFLMEFEVSEDNLCCPVASDGEFRVAKCRKIGECDWTGNLKQAVKHG